MNTELHYVDFAEDVQASINAICLAFARILVDGVIAEMGIEAE